MTVGGVVGRPTVWVVVLNWNNWRDTIVCLESLLRSDNSNFDYRVIVCDNGSEDGSPEFIKAWAEEPADTSMRLVRDILREPHLPPLPRPVPYIEHDLEELKAHDDASSLVLIQTRANLGFAGGNNVGVRYALKNKADYVWLLNNDTVVHPNALKALVDTAQDDEGVGLVGSTLYYMEERDQTQSFGGGWIGRWMGVSRHFTSQVSNSELHFVTGASLLIRTKVFEDIGFLDEDFFMYWEDVDYGFKARKAGWKLAVAPETQVWHKESAGLGKESPLLDSYFNASAVRFFKRHHSVPLVPIFVGVGGRMLKRVARRDWERARAVWRGALTGWRS